MLAIVKERPEPGVTIKEIPTPEPNNGEVLVKVKGASICGTDVSIYDWTPWAQGHIQPPIIIGHEVVGEILEINDDNPRGFKKGDLVSSETHIFCGSCYQCSNGNKHICEKMQLFGIGRDGGFAQYATIPIKTTWKNDPNLPLEIMSVQEPLGNAVHVVAKAEVKDKTVLVIGLGPVGLCAGVVAKVKGAKKVIGINPTPYRQKIAHKLGFDEVLTSLPEELVDQGDIVLEMSGSEKGVESALQAARISGKIIAFGIPKKPIPIDIGKYLINKELTIQSVFGRKIWETWEQVSNLLTQKQIDLSPLVTHKYKLEEFEKAMAVMKSEECGKILLIP